MRRIAMVTLLCLFALPVMGYAKGPRGHCGLRLPEGKWWRMPKVAEKLNVTAEEQERLDELFVASERRLIDLRSDVQKQELELKALLDQADLDAPACAAQFDKLLNARSAVARERFSFHVAVRDLLGLERYRVLLATFRDHRRHGMHGDASSDKPEQGGGVQQ